MKSELVQQFAHALAITQQITARDGDLRTRARLRLNEDERLEFSLTFYLAERHGVLTNEEAELLRSVVRRWRRARLSERMIVLLAIDELRTDAERRFHP